MDDAGKFNDSEDALSRREFTVAAAAAGAATAAVAGEAGAAAARQVVEKDVVIKTASGDCDAALYYPEGKGTWPGVLVAADALGLRPAFREMGKRLAAEGYVVLIPNPFYRSAKSPVFDASFSFNNAADRAKLGPLMGALTPEVVTGDVGAWLDYLDAQPQTNKRKKVGVQGYCMGGPTTVRAAAARPNRVGAACSFHGGGLTTDKPDSPHLLIPKTKAAFYFGVADNDDKTQPESKDILRKTLDDAKRPGVVTVYHGAQHGWCMSDFPVYNAPSAEIAWANLLATYRQNIA
jgi:carboxymethylenebutenolidase